MFPEACGPPEGRLTEKRWGGGGGGGGGERECREWHRLQLVGTENVWSPESWERNAWCGIHSVIRSDLYDMGRPCTVLYVISITLKSDLIWTGLQLLASSVSRSPSQWVTNSFRIYIVLLTRNNLLIMINISLTFVFVQAYFIYIIEISQVIESDLGNFFDVLIKREGRIKRNT